MRSLLFLVTAAVAFAASPKPAPLNDTAIEANIRAKFAKSKISEEHFKVSVKSGVALIEGKTDIPQRKGVATRLAKTGGAREVVNKIQVGEAARKKMSDRLAAARDKRAAKAAVPAGSKSTSKPPAQTSPPAKAATIAPPPAVASAEPAPLKRMQIKR
jgi:osmotically-inducible protein OsmY